MLDTEFRTGQAHWTAPIELRTSYGGSEVLGSGPHIAMRKGVARGEERRVMSGLERILLSIGFTLLAIWGVVMVESLIFSRAALAEFRANQATNASGGAALDKVASRSEISFTSWASKRLQAYRDSLLKKVDAPLAVLRIPTIHLEVPVFNGSDDRTLNLGVGRIIGTAQLGAAGNLGIAGHRDGFFRGLKDVARGDVIELVRPSQSDFYVVDRIQIVSPKDLSALESTAAPSLTLVTCFPFYFVGRAPQRYIVKASLMSSSRAERSAGKDSL